MKRALMALCTGMLLFSSVAQAEYRHVDLTVFGMD